MKKLITLPIFLFTLALQAQNLVISGQLTDDQNQPLIGGAAVLLNPGDSSMVKGSAGDIDGNFTIAGLSEGRYLLKLSYLGYTTLIMEQQLSASVNLGRIVLQPTARNLGQVDVVGKIPPVQIKGDTTQYNAAAYKTNPDASAEDLVTKMPGVTVVDGKVQAQGEEVKSVLVDGKQFFGDDASAVLKNLPAEVIDNIQVFDKRSDQSQFTGFDDGNTTKTINIVTKPEMRNGVFGRMYGGYGYQEKWRGGVALNFFKDKRRITLLANSNNINEQNFSSDDLAGVMSSGGQGGGGRGAGGSGGRPGGGGSGGADNFLVNPSGGITQTNAFGINYSNTWGKVELTGSYFFNRAENNATGSLYRTYISPQNEGLTYSQSSVNSSINTNHRANFRIEWKVDSLNSFLFQPKFSYQKNDGSSSLAGRNMLFADSISNTINNYQSNLWALNFSTPILYRHAFGKRGRTISINASPGYNQTKANSNLLSYTGYYSDTLTTDTLNQISNLNKQGYVLTSTVTYTEPLSKTSQLMFNYSNNFNKSNSDKQTFGFEEGTNAYSRFDTSLSNTFNSFYHSESGGVTYRIQKEKWNMMAGLSYQWAQLQNERIFPFQYNLTKTFISVLPSTMFQYKFNPKKTLRIFYRSNNNAPSVDQLQDVINNSNALQLTTGNANLTQDFQNTLNVRYSAVNATKNTSFFALLGGTYTNNYIGKSTYIAPNDTVLSSNILLARGSQLTMPVNLNGYYNARAFVNYSFPISKIKTNMSINAGGNYSHTPGLINGDANFANNTSASVGIVFSSNISTKFDFTLSSNSSYNNIANTLQTNSNSTFYNQNSRFKIQAQPWKGLVIQTDINHQFYSGLSSSLTQNYLLWNAAIGYKFLKNQAAEIRLTVFDILKQNNSVSRNTTETYYEDTQTNVLQRYFMLTFTYNLKVYKGKGQGNP